MGEDGEAASQGLRWSGSDGLGWRVGAGSRETDRCTGEREMWFTFLISFYQALGELGTKTRREKERRSVRRREMVTKYVYEHASMQRCDQGCTLSTLFSCYICCMTAVCESVTDLNSNSKKCKKNKIKSDLNGYIRNTPFIHHLCMKAILCCHYSVDKR